MLDFANLEAPAADGGVLVIPDPAGCTAAVRRNAKALGAADVPMAGSTLAEWRHRTRLSEVSSDDSPVIVTGHQPAFIHPGVWAKHIVSRRLADAVGGTAINLVVDCDAPSRTTLSVPSVTRGRAELQTVRFADLSAGLPFEQIERHGHEEIARFQTALQEATGERYDASQLACFFDGFRNAKDNGDWVDQAIAGRRAVESDFGMVLDERRVSKLWWTPLLVDMLLAAERFSRCYNGSLARYRKENRIRGRDRPIPDLDSYDGRWELPVWVYRDGEPRRRLFVSRRGDSLLLSGDRISIEEVSVSDLETCADANRTLGEESGWRFRPRALTLTIWARLLLADLFVHGIGGAKYDRISDTIIADYYGLAPPEIACVSATLRMGLPHKTTTVETVRSARRQARDVKWNPQRHLTLEGDLEPLAQRRDEVVKRARQLRENNRTNHDARRKAFEEIRRIGGQMLAARPDALANVQKELERTIYCHEQTNIARGREYFFALYDREALERLLEALPAEQAFGLPST